MFLIELPICNSAKRKMEFRGHSLQYSSKPNVRTSFTESSRATNFTFIVSTATLTWSLLIIKFQHRQGFTPIYQPLHQITLQCLQQKCTEMAYPSQYDNKLAVNIYNDYISRFILMTKSRQ